MYKYIFGEKKPLAQNPKPWHINLLLEISRSAWQEISTTVEEKFGLLCKDAEYLALKDLLDNSIPLVLDIYAIFFRSGDFNTYFESCFRVWTVFFRSTQKHTEAQQIINYGHYLNQLRLDNNGFRENFVHMSTWAAYEYFARDISHLTKKCACFLLQCFLEIYEHVFHSKTLLTFSQSLLDSSSKKKGKEKCEE
ncbi:hypothetical protein C2G38_2170704 [Gigaspora rosea]|uniref:Uncharacterized protein n=1 Tax=Gigaspora rosea TaxID=44941 RepID=A0A397VMB1_9GLOM|nr:hypothetical protein C2G38_2170704 [Gigaspora rosea]